MSQDPVLNQKKTINCRGKIMDLSVPRIMGILNATPDSFFDGGKYDDTERALERAGRMLEEGADILDIGGVSTRPGAEPADTEEELIRVIPVIRKIRTAFPGAVISVDTYRAEVARLAVENGADMVNDISGGEMDEQMFTTVSRLRVPYVLLHMQGTPQNMQQNPVYGNVVRDVAAYFSEKITRLNLLGVNDIILDPGYGFGKTVEHNLTLLHYQQVYLHAFHLPVLAGLSRKSMIRKITGASPAGAMPGSLALHWQALQNGASLLRVHDVAETLQVVKLYREYQTIP